MKTGKQQGIKHKLKVRQRKTPNSESVSLKKRAEEFLSSETPASYATQITLALVILAGIAIVATVAPGLSILARGYRRSRYYSQTQINGSLYNLKKRGLVKENCSSHEKRLVLTKKGETFFRKMLFDDVRLPTQATWDGKWRFVLFDIPVKYTKARDALRFRLKALGFYQYQKSVWAYPHPCEKEILYVADYFGVGKFIEVFEAIHLSNDKELKKHFEL
ncbi:MAG: hypothetical protein HYT94_05125 [Parcubacteria group bacterium]|nr:hypothetical protein [Parcubacteria group bacterium]